MQLSRRNWLQTLGGIGAAGLGASLFSPSAAAQQGAATSRRAGAAYPAQKNKQLVPYKTRRLPWKQRVGAKVWPNGARMAVATYCSLELWEWEGPTMIAMPGLQGRSGPRASVHLGITPLNVRTAIQFGGEIGCHRLKECLEDVGLGKAVTLLMCGSYAEDYPDVVKELGSIGCEMMAHTYSYSVATVDLTRDQQREDMQRTVRILEQITGQKPVGWLSQGATCDQNTIELNAELGFLYNADLQDDELPYFIDVNSGKTIVAVPYRMIGNLNDHHIITPETFRLSDALGYWKDKFDLLYRTASKRPLLTTVGTHPHIIGRADNMWVLYEFFQYVKKFEDVWIASYKDVAEWWMKQFNNGYNV